jgi:hypothetical protein
VKRTLLILLLAAGACADETIQLRSEPTPDAPVDAAEPPPDGPLPDAGLPDVR